MMMASSRERERGCCWLFSAAAACEDAVDVGCPLSSDDAPTAEAGDGGAVLIGSELKGEDKYLGAAVGDDGRVFFSARAARLAPNPQTLPHALARASSSSSSTSRARARPSPQVRLRRAGLGEARAPHRPGDGRDLARRRLPRRLRRQRAQGQAVQVAALRRRARRDLRRAVQRAPRAQAHAVDGRGRGDEGVRRARRARAPQRRAARHVEVPRRGARAERRRVLHTVERGARARRAPSRARG